MALQAETLGTFNKDKVSEYIQDIKKKALNIEVDLEQIKTDYTEYFLFFVCTNIKSIFIKNGTNLIKTEGEDRFFA